MLTVDTDLGLIAAGATAAGTADDLGALIMAVVCEEKEWRVDSESDGSVCSSWSLLCSPAMVLCQSEQIELSSQLCFHRIELSERKAQLSSSLLLLTSQLVARIQRSTDHPSTYCCWSETGLISRSESKMEEELSSPTTASQQHWNSQFAVASSTAASSAGAAAGSSLHIAEGQPEEKKKPFFC